MWENSIVSVSKSRCHFLDLGMRYVHMEPLAYGMHHYFKLKAFYGHLLKDVVVLFDICSIFQHVTLSMHML